MWIEVLNIGKVVISAMTRLNVPPCSAPSLLETSRGRNPHHALTARERNVLAGFKEAAGRTELLRLDLPVPNNNRIYAKCEFQNPTGSHYDRVYPLLLEILLENGFTPDKYGLVETSSGNATPAFVRVCRELGFEAWAVLPRAEELSETRLRLTKNEGASVVHPDPCVDGYGLVGVANRMLRLIRESRGWEKPLWSPNHSAISETLDAMLPLAQEIVDAVERIDYFLGIPGNGTTLCGVGAPLKEAFPEMRIIAAEPRSNPGLFLLKHPEMREKYLRDGTLPDLEPSPLVHEYKIRMPGSGCYGMAERFPHILDSVKLVDSVRQIDDEGREWEKPLHGGKSANELLFEAHGIRVGNTSAASLMAALELAEKVSGKNILLIFYDLKEGRY